MTFRLLGPQELPRCRAFEAPGGAVCKLHNHQFSGRPLFFTTFSRAFALIPRRHTHIRPLPIDVVRSSRPALVPLARPAPGTFSRPAFSGFSVASFRASAGFYRRRRNVKEELSAKYLNFRLFL